jgi:hypothetical protein
LAERHRISAIDLAYAMEGYADNLLDDAIYNVKSELEREIETDEPVSLPFKPSIAAWTGSRSR